MGWEQQLTEEQRERMVENILATERELGSLLEATVAHLRDTDMNCVRCCVGELAGQTILDLDPLAIQFLLTIAIRQLAEARLEAEQKRKEG